MKYFNNVKDLSELRKQYKELLKVHHPDNGGNVVYTPRGVRTVWGRGSWKPSFAREKRR